MQEQRVSGDRGYSLRGSFTPEGTQTFSSSGTPAPSMGSREASLNVHGVNVSKALGPQSPSSWDTCFALQKDRSWHPQWLWWMSVKSGGEQIG